MATELSPRVHAIFGTLGRTITSLREAAGLTIPQLGRKARMPAQKIADLEAGTCNVYLQDVLRLAKALDVSVSELLRETDWFYGFAPT